MGALRVLTTSRGPIVCLSLVVGVTSAGVFYWLATVFPILTEVLGAIGALSWVAITVVLTDRFFGTRLLP
jgi:hypothetical protein